MKKLINVTFILFTALLAIGLLLASCKLIWNDEIYTQQNLEKTSYLNMISGHMIEGNLCPLFYIPQKLFLETIHYKLPFIWKHESNVYEPRSQILMRIPGILYMSLGLALIFYIFARLYSYKIGFFALVLTLSNPMPWMYWAEARPYSLWFLLTALQASLLLKLLHQPQGRAWLWLILCHILLSLTIIFSLPQILIVSLILGLIHKNNWNRVLYTSLVPIMICYFYYAQMKHTYDWFPSDATNSLHFMIEKFSLSSFNVLPNALIYYLHTNIPFPWIIPLILYIVFLIKKPILKLCAPSTKEIFPLKEGVIFIWCLLALLLSSAFILLVFSILSSSKTVQFAISDRFFIMLVPYAVFTLVLSGLNFLNQTKDSLLRLMIICIYGGTCLTSGLLTVIYLISWGIF